MYEKIRKAGKICFWTAFVIELIIVMIDKSAYTNPYESYLFRFTFVLFCIKILTTKYSKKEWIVIAVCGAASVLAYFINERDELVRAAVFVTACKDVDLRKMLRTTLFVTFIGSVLLFALSALGIYGKFAITANFGRGATEAGSIETRYCFGMGHPNSFQVMLFMMSTLVIYLYAENMRLIHFILIGLVSLVSYLFTDSNTAFLVMLITLAGVMVLKYFPTLREKTFVYIAAALVLIAVVAFSAYGSHVGRDTPFMFRLDKLLNGRFQYANIVEAARIENWKLFADAANQEYFDQGFIRLFYWYGIIPGLMYCAANLYLIWQSYKYKDYCLMVIVTAYAVLSLMEAHLISVYLLRNYLLIWLGYYWYRPFGNNVKNMEKGELDCEVC